MKKYPELIDRLKHQLFIEEQANSVLFNQPFSTIEIYKNDAVKILDILKGRANPTSTPKASEEVRELINKLQDQIAYGKDCNKSYGDFDYVDIETLIQAATAAQEKAEPKPAENGMGEALDALEYLTKDGTYDDEGLAAIRTIKAALRTAPTEKVETVTVEPVHGLDTALRGYETHCNGDLAYRARESLDLAILVEASKKYRDLIGIRIVSKKEGG